jgi:SAM-dependent methyltransferase
MKKKSSFLSPSFHALSPPGQAGENWVDTAALVAEMERLGPWLHDVEIAPGLSTASTNASANGGAAPDKTVPAHFSPDKMMKNIFGQVYGEAGLAGRSFLDCGCNAGGHSFAAARLGASRAFAFDARQHWLDQAAFLARFANAPQVELGLMTLGGLRDAAMEPFDVTLFSGLFYHLPDPVGGLKIAADLTKELLIVNTSWVPLAHDGLVLNRESASHVLSGIDGLAWLPTGPRVMLPILAWCGFHHMRVEKSWRVPGPPHWSRMQIIAARDEKTFEHFDRLRPDAHPDRALRRSFGQRARAKLARIVLG